MSTIVETMHAIVQNREDMEDKNTVEEMNTIVEEDKNIVVEMNRIVEMMHTIVGMSGR